jgi:predicted aminopeptidase
LPFAVLVLLCNTVLAQSNTNYQRQIQLIDSLRNFITKDLKLNIADSFYMKWKNTGEDKMYNYVYASFNDSIKTAHEKEKDFWFYTIEDSAVAKINQLKAKGYHTLLYKTAGTSDAQLNHKLLSYPDEAIAFIVFHEATHQHIRSQKNLVPYIFEEALCDAFANKACLAFAQKTNLLNIKDALKQQRIFEKLYAFLNKQKFVIEKEGIKQQEKVFNSSTSKIKSTTRKANQFQKDRMIYEVNNAYFVRIIPYTLHYFEVKDMLEEKIELNKEIKEILKKQEPH